MAIAGRRTRTRTKRVVSDGRDNALMEHTNTRIPLDSIIKSLDGSKMVVDYYNKQVSMNETIVEFDINNLAYLTNFNRIDGLHITVTTEISVSGEITDIRGVGLIASEIYPTIGDVFIAKLSGNTQTLMGVNKVTRTSYNNLDVFEVEYSAIKFFLHNEDVSNFVGLMGRGLMEDLVYDPKHQINNSSPILKRVELDQIKKISSLLYRLKDRYIAKSYNEKQGTFLFMQGDKVLLDGHLQDFIARTFDGTKHSSGTHHIYNVMVSYGAKLSIFDLLLGRTTKDAVMPYLNVVSSASKLNPTNVYDRLIYDNSLGLVDIHGDGYLEKDVESYEDGKCKDILPDDVSTLMFEDSPFNSTRDELFPELNKDTYVFSPEFYGVARNKICVRDDVDPLVINLVDAPVEELTLIEEVVEDYLEDFVLDKKELITLMMGCEKLDYEKTIYYVPIVMFLASTVLQYRADSF